MINNEDNITIYVKYYENGMVDYLENVCIASYEGCDYWTFMLI